jgi:hypothetical protein
MRKLQAAHVVGKTGRGALPMMLPSNILDEPLATGIQGQLAKGCDQKGGRPSDKGNGPERGHA